MTPMDHLNAMAAHALMADRRDVAQAAAFWLETERTHGPLPAFDDLAGEAMLWASVATPHELEAYHAAILSELDTTQFHVNQKKRIFARIWTGFSDQDREGFLRKYGRTHDPA